jgi:hypothetical protein
LFLFWIWAIFDCISTDATLCRNLPKGMWLILVLFIPDIGSLAWLLLGRPERAGWRPGATDYSRSGPLGMEDHPRYSPTPEITDRRSAEMDRELEEWERAQAAKGRDESERTPPPDHLDAWEAELNQREEELRRRELELRERELREREDGLEGTGR